MRRWIGRAGIALVVLIALALGGVWVRSYWRLDAFSWHVENKEVVSVEMAADGAHVRITGMEPGSTIVHLGYRTTSLPLRATVLAPAP